MPLLALSANARLIVPVGAIESRCELRMPYFLIFSLTLFDRREAKLPPDKYRSALNNGKTPRSLARSAEYRYARSRMYSEIFAPISQAAEVS